MIAEKNSVAVGPSKIHLRLVVAIVDQPCLKRAIVRQIEIYRSSCYLDEFSFIGKCGGSRVVVEIRGVALDLRNTSRDIVADCWNRGVEHSVVRNVAHSFSKR